MSKMWKITLELRMSAQTTHFWRYLSCMCSDWANSLRRIPKHIIPITLENQLLLSLGQFSTKKRGIQYSSDWIETFSTINDRMGKWFALERFPTVGIYEQPYYDMSFWDIFIISPFSGQNRVIWRGREVPEILFWRKLGPSVEVQGIKCIHMKNIYP